MTSLPRSSERLQNPGVCSARNSALPPIRGHAVKGRKRLIPSECIMPALNMKGSACGSTTTQVPRLHAEKSYEQCCPSRRIYRQASRGSAPKCCLCRARGHILAERVVRGWSSLFSTEETASSG